MLLRFPDRRSGPALALACLLFWAPLPAGSITPLAELLFRLAAVALFVVAVTGAGERWSRLRALPVAALAAVALLGVAQSCRWPDPLAAALSPEHARLYSGAAALVAASAAEPGVPLSLDAAASRSSAVSWLAAAALLGAALAVGRWPRHRRWLLSGLLLAAGVELVLGLLTLQASGPVGFAQPPAPGGRLRGTYANPNHLALLFEIAMAAAAAWTWRQLTLRSPAPAAARRRALIPLALWLLLLVGVLLTGSRAGLAAAAFGLVVQVAVMVFAGRGRGSRLAVAVLAVAAVALAAVASRFEMHRYRGLSLYEENLQGRLLVVAPTLELWRRFPVTGSGLGTFEDAFPMVAPPELTRELWNRAHNNPLELLATGGVVGLGLAALALAALLPPILRVVRQGRDPEDRAAGLAALGALAAAGLHELLDFGLVIPGNHLALLVVVGAAAAAGLSPPSPPSRASPRSGSVAAR